MGELHRPASYDDPIAEFDHGIYHCPASYDDLGCRPGRHSATQIDGVVVVVVVVVVDDLF